MKRIYSILSAVALVGVAAGVVWWLTGPPAGDPRLRPFVQSRPSVPIVFTSRGGPASLRAAADVGEGFSHPGQPLWAEAEGRLRVLRPDGEVLELTWGRELPDGSTLIDVMSPTVSPDGERVVFAGRKKGGRFRIYKVDLDGDGLLQITGTEDDPGCTALPPLRYGPGGKKLSDDTRRSTDYDDVDPAWLGDGSLVFASSRVPDLSPENRRATHIWRYHPETGERYPLSANRYNDRWPFALVNGDITFSLWSHNVELIPDDRSGVEPTDAAKKYLTRRPDSWLGASIQPSGEFFAGLVKVPTPVWRPRPLFNGNLVFMTRDSTDPEKLRLAQAAPNTFTHAPSSLVAGIKLAPALGRVTFGPALATPSPMPPDRVVATDGRGLVTLPQSGWGDGVEPTPLFDDPDLIDAEPVAVYRRPLPTTPITVPRSDPAGLDKDGPVGQVENASLYADALSKVESLKALDGTGAVIGPPPEGSIKQIAFYAAERDRFDDPDEPRIRGSWKFLKRVPVRDGTFSAWLPTADPTVLVALNGDGRVVRWPSQVKGRDGRRAEFLAVAGDHYSGVKPKGYHFCLGCHTGHSSKTPLDLAEHVQR